MSKRGFGALLHAYIYLSAQYYRLEYLLDPATPDELWTAASNIGTARYMLFLIHQNHATLRQLKIWAGANNTPFEQTHV
jgi:hypothetical protein